MQLFLHYYNYYFTMSVPTIQAGEYYTTSFNFWQTCLRITEVIVFSRFKF